MRRGRPPFLYESRLGMKIAIGKAAADAWALWRRDRDLLIAVAGPFLFLPTLTLLLMVPLAPQPLAGGASEAEMAAFLTRYVGWASDNIGWFLIAGAITLYGGLALSFLYLDRQSEDLRAALLRALPLLPRYALASLIIAIPATAGALLFVLPGLYVLARAMLIGPVMVVERPLSAIGAVQRSLALTRGNGLALAAVVGVGLLAAQLLPAPFLAIDEAMRTANAANPVVIMLIDSVAAALAAAVALALILLRIAIYRRVAAIDGI